MQVCAPCPRLAARTRRRSYGTVRLLQFAEKVFILKEKKEMAAEMDLTGMYIAINADKVEGAVDPKTGKNITLAAGADKMPGAGDVEAADGAPIPPILTLAVFQAAIRGIYYFVGRIRVWPKH